MKTLLLFVTFFITIPNTTFLAKRGLFGKQETIKKLQDVSIKGSKGEDLYLGYKTSALFVFFGVYFKDDGYVLGIKKGYGSYYPLDEKQIKEFQEQGHLPKPLPKYSISFFDYLMGYSLWIVLPFIIGFQILKHRYKKQAKASQKTI
jgi:hypothetical protein